MEFVVRLTSTIIVQTGIYFFNLLVTKNSINLEKTIEK